jgi:septal ring factor EnvC (AmiA/AmiB activator)
MVVAGGGAPPAAAAAQTAQSQTTGPQKTLSDVERSLAASRARDAELARSSDALEKELEGLRHRMVQVAEQATRLEAELTELEETLRVLEAEERTQAAKLDAEKVRISSLLGALQRLSRIPPEAMIGRDQSPVDTLRSALLLRSTVPALQERADALAAAIRQFVELRATLDERRGRAEKARTDLSARQADIALLVERRLELQQQTETEREQVAQRMARLGNEAKDLRALIERLEREQAERLERERREAEARRRAEERRKAEEAARLAAAQAAARDKAEREKAAREAAEAEAREREKAAAEAAAAAARVPDPPPRDSGGGGGTRLPVAGQVTTRYGEADRFGVTSRGLTVATRPGAQVVAPSAGSVMFAGPFRGYGLILIVEHPNGYHSLIAGLGRIDANVGQRVLAGEPLGVMGTPADGNPDLYFELRRNGQPINPQRGLPGSDGKGQG